MANESKKTGDASMLGRLAGAGEDAVTRLVDELSRNTRVTEALSRAMSAKDRVVSQVGSVGFSSSEEVAELRTRIEKLEKRIVKLEGTGSKSTRAKSGRKVSTTTKASGGTTSSRSKATSPGSSTPGAGSSVPGEQGP